MPARASFRSVHDAGAGAQVLDVPALEVIFEVLDHRLIELELERQLLFQDDDLVLQALAGAVAEVLQFLGAALNVHLRDVPQIPLPGPGIEIELDAPRDGVVFNTCRYRHGLPLLNRWC